MLKLLKLSSIVALTAAIVGCGKDDPPPYDPGNYPDIPVTYDYGNRYDNSIQSFARDKDLVCEQGTCPKNVGALFMNLGYDAREGSDTYGHCTASLVAPDMIMTNAHCLPDRYTVGSDCSNSIAFVTLTDGQSSATTVSACKKVEAIQSNRSDGIDIAFLRIENHSAKPFVIKKNGIQHRENLTTWNVTFKHSRFVLHTQSCQNNLKTFVNAHSPNPLTTSGAIVGCQVVHGNSGSPLLNRNGEVVGVIHGATKTKEDSHSDPHDVNFGLKEQTTFNFGYLPPHGFFTGLSCLADPAQNVPVNAGCADRYPLMCRTFVAKMGVDMLAESYPQLQKLINELSPAFDYVYDLKHLDSPLIEASAKCVRPEFANGKNQFTQTFNAAVYFQPEYYLNESINFRKPLLMKTNIVYKLNLKRRGSFGANSQIWDGDFSSTMTGVPFEPFRKHTHLYKQFVMPTCATERPEPRPVLEPFDALETCRVYEESKGKQ